MRKRRTTYKRSLKKKRTRRNRNDRERIKKETKTVPRCLHNTDVIQLTLLTGDRYIYLAFPVYLQIRFNRTCKYQSWNTTSSSSNSRRRSNNTTATYSLCLSGIIKGKLFTPHHHPKRQGLPPRSVLQEVVGGLFFFSKGYCFLSDLFKINCIIFRTEPLFVTGHVVYVKLRF